jgi:hypothetical protein
MEFYIGLVALIVMGLVGSSIVVASCLRIKAKAEIMKRIHNAD